MAVQVIMRDGIAEYAVVPWDEYQALLQAAGQARSSRVEHSAGTASPSLPGLAQLQSLREQQGLTREQLAQAVGISPVYLALIEQAERQPDTAICRALARILGQPGWSDSP